MNTPHGKIARALCEAAEDFASDPFVWAQRSREATEILEDYVHRPMRARIDHTEFHKVTTYKTTGKLYSDTVVAIARAQGYESRGDLWRRIIAGSGGSVPGLSTPAEDCPFVVVVEPMGDTSVPFVVMPTHSSSPKQAEIDATCEKFKAAVVSWAPKMETKDSVVEGRARSQQVCSVCDGGPGNESTCACPDPNPPAPYGGL